MKYPIPALLIPVLLMACGGGGSSSGPGPRPTASALSYQDPPATTGFSLIQDTASSTSTHLVLDLVGTAGAQTLGVAFFLAVDPSMAAWSASTGSYVTPGAVIPLGSAPQMLAAKAQGGNLQVGLFQKGGPATTLGTAPILAIALDLQPGATPGTVTFAAQAGKTAVTLEPGGTLSTISVNVGTLTAR